MAVHFICRIEDLVASGSQLVWSLAHHTLRRWFNQGLMLPCRRYLKTWLRIGECYQMTEGRLCLVHLLDDRKLELLVQPKLLSRELLDLVSSHFNLKEKEYFGLCFIDDTGQNNWLQLERRVLDHAFSKKTGPLELKFLVRFYIEKITFLKDNTTVELFFLNAKSSVFNEAIEVESKKVFKLAAFALQEAKGEYTSTETARSDLKQLPVLPTNVLKEHPSLSYCEDRVIEHYAELRGLSRGQAVVQYLALVESLPTYGVHYYPVKDKQGIPWWLGVSYKGIGQYDFQDKVKPRKLFQWKQLENLYFREKKFAVEVNDPHKRAVTKRTFGQAGLVIHSWYASHSLIKTIWAMAISQHQFYLDRKQSKSKLTSTRSTGDIAMDLTEVAAPRVSKLSSMQGKDQLIMASNGSLISAGSGESDADEQQKREKMAELKRREKALQDRLAVKLEELKTICVREAELTGKLPKEYPLATGEKAPQIRRRVGAAFKLDDLFPYNEDPHLRDLESKFALQHKIVEAARRLADEGDLCKTVKRKRRNNCLDATRRLHAIEGEINAYRVRMGKKPTQRASLIIADDVNPSELSSLSDSLTLEDDDELGSQRQRSRSIQYSPRPHHSDSRLIYGHAQEPLGYSPHDEALSNLYAPASRQPRDARSMPPTPLLTRNAYSSTQLRCDDVSQHFRQRSGSLESQSHFPAEGEPRSRPAYVAVAPPPRRSNSTEVLDDGSSYTSQSSAEYSGPGNHHHHHHHNPRVRGRHRKELYAGTGSMPNLAQPEARCYAYQPRERPSATAYYVTGYPGYAAEPEPYAYDDETEGHYSVAPVYQHHQHHYAQEPYGSYGNDEVDSMSQYATLRHARSRAHPAQSQPQSRCPGNEHPGRTMQKALVAEHLRGWYQRNTGHRQQVAYDYDRGSQQSLGYQTMAEPYASSVCYSSASSASTRTWQGHMGGGGPVEYDVSMHAHQSYSYSTALYSQPAHSRSYMDVHHMDSAISSQMNNHLGPEDQIHWHEDSKPGTIV